MGARRRRIALGAWPAMLAIVWVASGTAPGETAGTDADGAGSAAPTAPTRSATTKAATAATPDPKAATAGPSSAATKAVIQAPPKGAAVRSPHKPKPGQAVKP